MTQNYVSGGAVNSDTNVKTQTGYDGMGETISSTDAKGNATTYTYDGMGDRVSSTDPNNHTRCYSYDATNQVVGRTYDGPGT